MPNGREAFKNDIYVYKLLKTKLVVKISRKTMTILVKNNIIFYAKEKIIMSITTIKPFPNR